MEATRELHECGARSRSRRCTRSEAYLARCGLETSLLELVKIRASQINGCAFCLDMHTKDARAAGRDRAADLPAERLARDARSSPTGSGRPWPGPRPSPGSARACPDALYEEARQHFTEKELVDLTWAVIAINGWNRIAISFRVVPGPYQPAKASH